MIRRGFALLTVLWMIALLGAIVGGSLSLARLGGQLTQNRIVLLRAGWAREACGDILLARFPRRGSDLRLDSVDLGRGTWCRASLSDPSTRLNINLASTEQLERFFTSDSLTDALLDWRDADDVPRPFGAEAGWYRSQRRRPPRNGPLADVAELSYVRGFEPDAVGPWAAVLTVRGLGRVNLNTAPAALLATVPGLESDGVKLILARRRLRVFTSADEVLSSLPPPARAELLDRYPDFLRATTLSSEQFLGTVEGRVAGARPVSTGTLTLVPVAGRLAVLRREVQ